MQIDVFVIHIINCESCHNFLPHNKNTLLKYGGNSEGRHNKMIYARYTGQLEN